MFGFKKEKEKLQLEVKTPTQVTSEGNLGDIVIDQNYIYICTAKDTWKRVQLLPW